MADWLTKSVGKIFGLTDPNLYRIFGSSFGGPTPSGKHVTADNALTLAAVWSCVGLISQTIATLPLMVFSKDSNGDRVAVPDHPLHSLIHDQPNADMTAVEFWEAIVAQALLWGNGYALKTVNGVGDVISLTLLLAERMTIRRMEDGSRRYYYVPWHGGRTEEYTEDQMLHIKGWSMDGLVGMSVISYARFSFGNAMSADEAAGKFFANGLNLSGFVETGGAALTAAQRQVFRESLDNLKGSGNTGKTMLLEGSFKYNPLSLSPADAQMLATREYGVDEVCRWFRVPAWMIGHMAKSTSWGTGLEQQMIGFLTFTLRPWLTRIEQRILMQLVKPKDRSRIFAEFNVEGLLRSDSAARASLYSTFAQNGIQTRNEIRRRENLPRVDVPAADEITYQSNLIMGSQADKLPTTQTPAGFGQPTPPRAPDPNVERPTNQ